ncbi:uncharacterized protein LOC141657407 [Silene latifolia]|uniref:uncharacterized protein LOC141657407 n=1 Tax=Silene latifolia TaxID=37657 RepID=UPI003D76BAB5
MEKEEKQDGGGIDHKRASSSEQEFVLQWGKRIQRVRFKDPCKSLDGIRRKITSPDASTFSSLTRITTRVTDGTRNGKSPSPEKEERCYTTRAAVAIGEDKENGRINMVGNGGGGGEDKGKVVLPKLYITLSSKEKEEDFLAMKGCKLPQRPKKRAKLIQRTLLLVSPGAWLTDMCQERYEVREKKTPKKRPRGLKAMGNVVDSDSE